MQIFFVVAFRGLDRLLPPQVLHRAFSPYAFARSLLARQPAPRGAGLFASRACQQSIHMNALLEFLPDRLCSPRWRGRCRIVGLDRLLDSRRGGRPVMLAFCHTGPYSLAGFWLRANGIPATILSIGSAAGRSRAKRYKDRFLPDATIPSALYLDQLRDLVEVFAGGGILMVAIDVGTGKQVDVPIGEGGVFRMATGAMRLAARYGAGLIPCTTIDEGSWRFRIELGRPVPEGYLAGDPDLIAAGEHLIAESLPHWLRHPEQCHPHVLRTFRPGPSAQQ